MVLTIKVIENVLSDTDYEYLFNLIQSSKINWHQLECITGDESNKDKQFSHWLKDANTMPSAFCDAFTPIFDILNVQILQRAKLNLTFQEQELRILGGWHHDFYRDKNMKKPFKELKVAIYYFNNTNGKTLIKENNNIREIDCKKNSLVMFSNVLEHTGMTHTDKKCRYILNIDYI